MKQEEGPLAGPVVAAAVVLRDTHFTSPIRDSKTLSPKLREQSFEEIYQKAYVGVGIMSEAVIDKVNILGATFLAMRNAVYQCVDYIETETAQKISHEDVSLLVDGNQFKTELPYHF